VSNFAVILQQAAEYSVVCFSFEQWFAGLGTEVAMCCSSDVLITGLNVYASALDHSL
jgi:hypothetical protein